MTLWIRLPLATRCGGCGVDLDAGTPVLAITIPGVRRQLIRCAACVEAEPAIAATAGPRPPTTDEDWKRRQSGEDR